MISKQACPKCRCVLNLDEMIVLIMQRGSARTLIGLHSDPGNYNYTVPPGTNITEGDAWDFYCPMCKGALQASECNDRLCRLELINQNGEPQQALFSRVAGEKATFIVTSNKVQQKFGPHATRFDPHLIHMKYIRY